MLNQALFDDIASGRVHLTMTELRVWAALISRADLNNYVRERQSWLAKEYGISRAHFSTALSGLIGKDMVIRLRDKGTGKHLMLSPFHFWKGSADQHKQGMAIYRHLAKASTAPADAYALPTF